MRAGPDSLFSHQASFSTAHRHCNTTTKPTKVFPLSDIIITTQPSRSSGAPPVYQKSFLDTRIDLISRREGITALAAAFVFHCKGAIQPAAVREEYTQPARALATEPEQILIIEHNHFEQESQ
jgi:hypothetical protein